MVSSILNHRVMLPGSNDAGFPNPGIEWTCVGGVLKSGPFSSANLRSGIVLNGEAQWLAPSHPGQAYFWSVLQARWGITRYSIGSDLCGTSPTAPAREHYALFFPPNDRFTSPGRLYYHNGGLWPDSEYDEWYALIEEVEGAELLFGVRSGSDWGVVILRRDRLESLMEGDTAGTEHNLEGDPAVIATLVTAPELASVPSVVTNPTPSTANFILGNKPLIGPTTNVHPRFFKLPSEEDPPQYFMLGVPAGRVSVDADSPEIQDWLPLPTPYGGVGINSLRHHLKVCIYDITDVKKLNNDGSPNIPAWTIIGPDKGFANDIQVKEFGGRTWLFVCDFTGELLVYDITNLLLETPGALTSSTFPPELRYAVSADLTDSFRSDLYGVVLDEVEWLDGETERHELYVYLGASRVGIEVLALREDAQNDWRLDHLGIVQVPGEAEGMWIRHDPDTDERQLIVCNTYGGVRILAYNP